MRGSRRTLGLALVALSLSSCTGMGTDAATATDAAPAADVAGMAATTSPMAAPPGETVGSRPSGSTGPGFGFGTPASAADISEWDIDIGPDGAGLPPGQGTVQQGLEVYRTRCIACHGPTGREGPYDLLAGRVPGDEFPFATDRSVRSTVGSYWPYATTLFDYTRRAMPFDFPGTLTDEEVYSVVGAMLYFNELLAADAVVDSATVVDTRMPARDRFVRDNRTGGPEIR